MLLEFMTYPNGEYILFVENGKEEVNNTCGQYCYLPIVDI